MKLDNNKSRNEVTVSTNSLLAVIGLVSGWPHWEIAGTTLTVPGNESSVSISANLQSGNENRFY